MRRSLPVLLLACLLAASCDEASPVAPPGTTLILTASPTQIALFGSATITAVARNGSGNPLFPGTEVRFSADRGSIEPIGVIGDNGTTTVRFTGDGRPGPAVISAVTGAGGTAVTVTVLVGQDSSSKPTLLVSANPSNVPVNGTSTITILARNADGSTMAPGTTVFLTTTLGTLSPSNPTTGSGGTATSRLSVGTQSGTAEVTAVVGNSDPTRTQVTIRNAAVAMSLQPVPATIPAQGGEIDLEVFVADAQGLALQGAPVSYQTDVGTLSSTVAQTNSQGLASVTLTVTETQLGSRVQFNVRASTPRGDGSLINAQATIEVE